MTISNKKVIEVGKGKKPTFSFKKLTSFGFFSCSELLQQKLTKKKVAEKCKLLSPHDSYRVE